MHFIHLEPDIDRAQNPEYNHFQKVFWQKNQSTVLHRSYNTTLPPSTLELNKKLNYHDISVFPCSVVSTNKLS